jgi:GNAT superfamily N-acetyltransferase
MPSFRIRTMTSDDWVEVAEMIYVSLNYWYASKGDGPKLKCGPEHVQLHCQVNEALDPGRCLVAQMNSTGRLAACCFYHPRKRHVSLGIMVAHPNYFGTGAAKAILSEVIAFAEKEEKPLRLVSSAMNLDSFSLYNRAGFVPYAMFQDMLIDVPPEGLDLPEIEGVEVRTGQIEDAPAMAALEREISGVERESDFRHFLENRDGIWHVSVTEDDSGGLNGFLCSVTHPGCSLIGPGVSRNDRQAVGLLGVVLNHEPGRTRVWLAPCDKTELVQTCYSWGARNCELHTAQVLGEKYDISGVIMPTFMPETW